MFEGVVGGLKQTFSAQEKKVDHDNNNDRRIPPSFRMVFTDAERTQLEELFGPYIKSGKVKKPEYKLGEDISCILFNRTDRPRSPIIFVVTKQMHSNGPQKAPADYLLNFGQGYAPTPGGHATINFAEVLRLGAMHLDRVFSISRQSKPAAQLT